MDALIGAGVLGLTALLFWRILPRNGKVHPLVGTPWEPYVALLFVGEALLSIIFIGEYIYVAAGIVTLIAYLLMIANQVLVMR